MANFNNEFMSVSFSRCRNYGTGTNFYGIANYNNGLVRMQDLSLIHICTVTRYWYDKKGKQTAKTLGNYKFYLYVETNGTVHLVPVSYTHLG